MGSLIGQNGVGGEIGDAMSGIGGLANSLFAPSSAPKQVKKLMDLVLLDLKLK